jgi:DNA-binding NarL/FixJ family response regulator
MAEPVKPVKSPEPKLYALVVEDDPSWQQILTEILTDIGLEVDLADHYEAAVNQMRARPHRLAVLDLSLGGTDHRNQDGLRVAEAVHRLDPNCTSIFLTGFATVELAVRVIQEQGAYTCLQKEAFRRAEFRKIVNQALAKAPTAVAEEPGLAEVNSKKGDVHKTSIKQSPQVALVVEDDAGWRSLLTELLEDAGYQVQTSSSYVEAFGLMRHIQFALAVVDLSLASSLTETNFDGYRLLNSTHKASITTIVVSGYAEPERIEKAFADNLIYACLEKQAFDRKAFINTVKNIKAGLVSDPALQTLTDREREVLVLIAQGLTNKEIAYKLTITPNTVKRHLKSLFAKLDVNTRSAASARAITMGIHPK